MNATIKNLGTDCRHFADHFVVYLKWVGIALLLGGVMGVVGAGFYYSLAYVTNIRTTYGWLIWLLPVGGMVIVALYQHFEKTPKNKENHGTNMVLAAVNSDEDIPLRMTPLIFVSSIISHLFGASVGREGAALQMGASIGSYCARLLKRNDNDKKIMIMTGMAAGFSAIFGAPITATIFSIEVISVGVMYYAALVPCALSSLTAIYVAKQLGVQYAVYSLKDIPEFTPFTAGMTMVLGILCALLSIIICIVLILSERFFKTIFENPYIRVFVSGTAIALMTLAVGRQTYNGLGTSIIASAVAGQAVWYACFLKLAFTAVSLAGGYRGGEIIPTLVMGATFGCWAASFLGLPPALGAALGMTAVFCGVTNSPIASFIMGLELFGGKGIWFFGIVVAVSYMLSDYYGIYKSQLIIYSKYRSVYVHRRANH